jgi:hypothetical protein
VTRPQYGKPETWPKPHTVHAFVVERRGWCWVVLGRVWEITGRAGEIVRPRDAQVAGPFWRRSSADARVEELRQLEEATTGW